MKFIKIFTTLFTFFLGTILLNQGVQATSDPFNYAPNYSFEDGNTKPDNWIPVSNTSCASQNESPNPVSVWDNSARTGNKSLSLKNINWQIQPQERPGWITQDYIPINFLDSESYGVSIFVNGKNDNNNLRVNMLLCFYDSNNNILGSKNTNTTEIFDLGWEKYGNNIAPNFSLIESQATKIKIALIPVCLFNRPCHGSIWFDDVSVRPAGNGLSIYKFNDSNRNGHKDLGENSLGARFQIYEEFSCIDKTDRYQNLVQIDEEDGYISFLGTRAGEYSVREILETGLENTTPLCQNITVQPKIIAQPAALYFGNVKSPTAPYFSQKDPAWGGQEYDSANTYGPFFCGTTMAGCGCATTSSAMLLKYYGVDNAPNGDPTNPGTLDSWLKTNHGYAFGAIKWNSVAAYSVKANTVFGTQKIKFSGVGAANDYETLDSDLSAGKPAILEEPGHFIIGTSINGATYNINDPYYQDRKTLASYSNNFLHMLRYEKTNTDLSAIYIQSPAPTDIFLTNSQGQRVGKDPATGTVYTEIPNSYYYTETEVTNQDNSSAQAAAGQGITTLIILTPQPDTYKVTENNSTSAPKIEFTGYDQYGDSSIKDFTNGATNIPTSFNLNYSPELGSTIKVERQVSVDYLPGTTKNPILIKDLWLPIAILGSQTFNVKDVDLNSLIIGLQGKPFKNRGIYLDINKDKIPDLLLLFNPKQAGVVSTDTAICITGKNKIGESFKGCDKIKVLGTGNPLGEVPAAIAILLKAISQ